MTDTESLAKFDFLVRSVIARVVERRASDAAFFRLVATHASALALLAAGASATDPRVRDLIASHARVDRDGFRQIDVEYCRDTIIVSATVFDSFLTDVSRFLLLLRPEALPKDRQIRLAQVFQAQSLPALITAAVDQYTHELSYKSLRERVGFLKDRFGVPVEQAATLVDECEELAALRNRLVHTASRYSYSVGERRGSVEVVSEALPVVTPEVADKSLHAVSEAVAQLSDTICIHVFGGPSMLAGILRSARGASNGHG